MNGWIAVDFDGTLVEYNKWQGPDHCGVPIKKMCDRVRQWLAEGKDVRIFTARIFVPASVVDVDFGGNDNKLIQSNAAEVTARMDEARRSRAAINKFCMEQFGRELPITCQKDFGMIALFDDRCVQLVPNTGERVDGQE